MGKFARHFASFMGWNFAFAYGLYLVGNMHLKLVQAIVVSFQTLVPSFTYYDLALPAILIMFFSTFWMLLRPRALRRK